MLSHTSLNVVDTRALAFVAACCLLTAAGCSGPESTAARRGQADTTPYWPSREGPRLWQEACYEPIYASIPEVPDAEMVEDDELCMTCHKAYVEHHHSNIHREQSCETCHGPGSEHIRTRGKEPGLIRSFKSMAPAEAAEVCLQCHEKNACEPGALWRTSAHAHAGVSCTDCHTGHYNVPEGTPATELARFEQRVQTVALSRLPAVQNDVDMDMDYIRSASAAMGAMDRNVCYKCHADKCDLERVSGHPHQMCGAVGMTCTTCHDPHGNVREETRTDLCLQCHKGHPTTTWHSSTHSLQGVACTDCHNPHPSTEVSPVVGIQHTHVQPPKRMPMAVDEPNVCYKCHAKIYAQFSLPSHHPLKEGKMVCSDCHDMHGKHEDNLKEPTLNMVCYRCHADKQGPFTYEHPPVTENCGICHNPHGAVANNMLHQPTTFLCLRCHTGHRKGPNFHDATLLQDVGTRPDLQRAFFTDCTQCHAQIHGSNVPSPHLPNAFMR